MYMNKHFFYLMILFFSSDDACSSHHGSRFNCFSFGKIILYEVVKKPEKKGNCWNKWRKIKKNDEKKNLFAQIAKIKKKINLNMKNGKSSRTK